MTTNQLTLLPGLPETGSGCYWMTDGVRIKIGYTSRPPRRRGGELKTELLLFIPGPPSMEEAEHRRWDELRIGRTEWFNLSYGFIRWIAQRMDPGDWDAQRALDWLIENHHGRNWAA